MDFVLEKLLKFKNHEFYIISGFIDLNGKIENGLVLVNNYLIRTNDDTAVIYTMDRKLFQDSMEFFKNTKSIAKRFKQIREIVKSSQKHIEKDQKKVEMVKFPQLVIRGFYSIDSLELFCKIGDKKGILNLSPNEFLLVKNGSFKINNVKFKN